jgi:hypothetical protein
MSIIDKALRSRGPQDALLATRHGIRNEDIYETQDVTRMKSMEMAKNGEPNILAGFRIG